MSSFKYIKLVGKGISPSKLGGREPRYEEVFAHVKIESAEYVPVKFLIEFHGFREILMNMLRTYCHLLDRVTKLM